MAEELPPGTPEVDDPLLVADLIRLLSIKGAIGRLPLADVVIPIVSLGDVTQPTVEIRAPAFRSTDVFSAGKIIAPGGGTLLADTGPLPTGTYDVLLLLTRQTAINAMALLIQHRDAANAATLMAIVVAGNTDPTSGLMSMAFSYELGTDERLRVINDTAAAAGDVFAITILARLRT